MFITLGTSGTSLTLDESKTLLASKFIGWIAMVPFFWLFTGIDGSQLLPHFCMSTVDGAVWWDVGDGDVADGAV
jgi:hypothetical protein